MKEEKNSQKKSKTEDILINFNKNIAWSSNLYSKILVDYFFNKSQKSFYSEILNLFSDPTTKKKKSLEEKKHLLVKQLLASDIDPVAFDVLLSNEINRRLKVRFGVAFLVFTLLFTIASYAIVVFDGIFDWGISNIAITALIIETPIQFVGLLYIIARNLFPSSNNEQTNVSGTFILENKEDKSV